MKKKLKVCLIGCGRAGMIHARNYAGNVRGAELIAFCDPVAECLEAATSAKKNNHNTKTIQKP